MRQSYNQLNFDQRIKIYEWLQANASELNGLTRPQIAKKAMAALPDMPLTENNVTGVIASTNIKVSMRRPKGEGRKAQRAALIARVDSLEKRVSDLEEWITSQKNQASSTGSSLFSSTGSSINLSLLRQKNAEKG